MKKTILYACSIIAFTIGACNSSNNDKNTSDKDSKDQAEDINEARGMDDADAKFLTKAAEGGMMEVELSKIAVAQAHTPDVKSFAQQMIDDHSKAGAELKALASKKEYAVPAEPTKETKEKMADLAKKTGNDFEKAYMDKMVDDHKETVDLFEKASTDGKDAEIKSFASDKLPTLKMHLEMAQKTLDMVKSNKK